MTLQPEAAQVATFTAFDHPGELKETFSLRDVGVSLELSGEAERAFVLTIGAKVLHLQALNGADFNAWLVALRRHVSQRLEQRLFS